MKVNRGTVMVVLALALIAPSKSSAARPPTESSESSARVMGEEGLRRFQAGKWREAYDLFDHANRVVHAATLVLFMAHCRARQGDLIAARRLYREVIREPLPENAPVQFQTAHAVARQELRWITPRVAVMKIVVTGVPEGWARVRVDGKDVPAGERDELGVVPGPHQVEVRAPGEIVQRTITTTAGHTAEVVVPLSPPDVPAELEAKPPPAPDLLLPAGMTLGLGGVALVTGAVAGGVSLHEADVVKSRCESGRCLPSDQASAASAGHLADVSTGMFVAGGIAAASGVVLAVLHVRAGRAHLGPAAGALHVDIGPRSVGVGGTF